MMNIWGMITTAYSLSLKKRPMLTEMTTSGVIWSLGDLATQHIERFQDNKKTLVNESDQPPDNPRNNNPKIDWRRNLQQAIYASVIWGPIAHKWYFLPSKLPVPVTVASLQYLLSLSPASYTCLVFCETQVFVPGGGGSRYCSPSQTCLLHGSYKIGPRSGLSASG